MGRNGHSSRVQRYANSNHLQNRKSNHVPSPRAVKVAHYRKLREAVQRRARICKWPTNALRHSFASYHLAKFQDAPALALQMGHTTTAMLFAHYRELVTPEAAEAYWKIRPANAIVNS
jgi:integrase